MTCYSKMTQEMRHKIVTNNGFLPKCITPFRIFSLPSQNLPYSAPEAALHLITLIFYRGGTPQGPHHGSRQGARRGTG